MSVLAGDWLYMQAFQMALTERNFRVLDLLIELTQNMVEGELLQLTHIGRMDLSERKRWNWPRARLHVFFLDARGWARCWDSTDETEESLAEYGHYAGLAFQLVDDLLDFTASPAQLGKPVLSDLKEGKVTLPLIYALESDGAAGRKLVATVLEERGFPQRAAGADHGAGARNWRAGSHAATRARIRGAREGQS